MNKYIVRRIILGALTAPLVMVGYGFIWGTLLLLGARDNGAFYGNLPWVAAAWILWLCILPIETSKSE